MEGYGGRDDEWDWEDVTWLLVVALAATGARFSADWTRYLDCTVALIALFAWGYRELRF